MANETLFTDIADETDFTSFRNGGIVAVKGVN
jgi:hypothetical protein